ncbi:MAG: PAS domain-containing protein [Actinomycetota bacterium]|nr:PAS domain-containing protein [Actinomycetota bacterium]
MPSPDTLIQVGLLGEAIDSGPVGVLVADENMRYIAANRFAAELLGYTRAQLLELRVTDVAPAPSSPEEYTQMIRKGHLTGSTELKHADGSTITARYVASKTTVAGMELYVSVLLPG